MNKSRTDNLCLLGLITKWPKNKGDEHYYTVNQGNFDFEHLVNLLTQLVKFIFLEKQLTLWTNKNIFA